MEKHWSVVFYLGLCLSINAQIQRVEPPNWWLGMHNDTLQLMVYGEGIGNYIPSLLSCQDCVQLIGYKKADSPNYLFIDLFIPKTTLVKDFPITFTHKNHSVTWQYQLFDRVKPEEEYLGFNSSDVIYLITPDRFANGNPDNDSVEGLLETVVDRNHDYRRHGGDIQGITNHLDYVAEMGFTAIWPSPLLANDMPEQSYHGYAMTDFYKVDPRFGTLSDYVELSEKAAKRGIKLIMDQVANHCGREHWWMKDLPFPDWVNYQDDFEQGKPITTTNHRRTVNQDAYASDYDKKMMEVGWFVSAMPDLNQKNTFLAKYLVQNSIWWIETLQLGGIRQDTYPYPNKEFMAKWAGAIMDEYPNFNIVGEEWSYNPLLVGYWQEGAKNGDGYDSNLTSTMDFPLEKAIVEALIEPESWDKGLVKIYEGLANDFYYPNPKSIMLFADNHDKDRIFTELKEDVALTKMAMAFILLAPRIPQVYYGTEILMQNSAKIGDHGLIRTDFPGGWEEDKVNAFTGEGLTTEQLKMQSFLKTVLNYRKSSSAIHQGSTKHFAPDNGMYVLFRYNGNEKLLLVLNKNEGEIRLDLNRFNEMDIIGKTGRNIISNEALEIKNELVLGPKSATIISIKK